MYYRARRPQGLLMLWRRSTACTALVEGIRHSALCAVLIDGIALTYNPPLHNRRTIVERAEQGWQYSMVHVENNGHTNLWKVGGMCNRWVTTRCLTQLSMVSVFCGGWNLVELR